MAISVFWCCIAARLAAVRPGERGDVVAGASPATALAFGLGSAGAEEPVDLDRAKRGNGLIAYLETL